MIRTNNRSFRHRLSNAQLSDLRRSPSRVVCIRQDVIKGYVAIFTPRCHHNAAHCYGLWTSLYSFLGSRTGHGENKGTMWLLLNARNVVTCPLSKLTPFMTSEMAGAWRVSGVTKKPPKHAQVARPLFGAVPRKFRVICT